LPANIASCIRGVHCVESGAAGLQKVGPEQANDARPEGTGGSPTTSQLDPVLHASWVTTRGCAFVKHIKQWLELRVRDLATSSRLLRCHSPILVRDEVAFSELRLTQWCGQGDPPFSRRDRSQLSNSKIRGRKRERLPAEHGSLLCPLQISSICHVVMHGICNLAKRTNYGPSQGKD
jgi:hypothetical protein